MGRCAVWAASRGRSPRLKLFGNSARSRSSRLYRMANKNILLIEPGYKNKYPPLGLMKIAQYHGPLGRRDHVRFIKGEDRTVLGTAWDRIYVTTLFSFEFQRIAQAVDFALEVANGQADKIFVG